MSVKFQGAGGASVTAAYDPATATISGRAPAGATVTVTIDGAAQTPKPVADASGAWSFAVSGLSGGSHSFSASAQVTTDGQTFTVGTSAPGSFFVTQSLPGIF